MLRCREGDIVAGLSVLESHHSVWCLFYNNGVREEGYVPRENLVPCERHEFVVQVAQTHPGQKWSIRGTAHIQGIEVACIQRGGVIEAWNQNCAAASPREMLRRGDVIVNANGNDHPLDMLTSLK